jgi:hypothetical protein
MSLDLSLNTSATAMSGGRAAGTGVGSRTLLTIGGTWAIGDTISLVFTDSITGTQVQVGAGNITGITPTFCFTFNDKEYLLALATVFFSAIGAPTTFNAPDGVDNGYVVLTNHYATPESLVAIASFQGRSAFFSRQGVQIWTTPADPAAWQLNQVFEFIGTRSPLSVKAVGDFEIFFLDETGIRSLRVRDNTLNAFSEDLGSPIDAIVQAKLVASSDAQKDAACGIVEPSTKRYWLFLKDTIYVFSNFPSSKIAAWSKYLATYNVGGVQTAFVPEKFVVFQGQVYARAGNSIFRYGGTDNNTYDNAVATAELPWLDAKTPSTRKSAKGLDVAMTGAWTLSVGMDPETGTLDQVFSGTTQSFDKGRIPYSSQGSHFKLKAITTGSTAAKLSSLIFKYELGDEE